MSKTTSAPVAVAVLGAGIAGIKLDFRLQEREQHTRPIERHANAGSKIGSIVADCGIQTTPSNPLRFRNL